MLQAIPIRVECHAGYRGEEYPKAFHMEGRRCEVTEILDRWHQGSADPRAPSVEYFKVLTSEGRRFVLKYEPDAHAWFLASELE